MTANESNVQYADGPALAPTHDAAYWAKITHGFDFSDADRVPPDLFNEVTWAGIKGSDIPYPTHRSGRILGKSSQ